MSRQKEKDRSIEGAFIGALTGGGFGGPGGAVVGGIIGALLGSGSHKQGESHKLVEYLGKKKQR